MDDAPGAESFSESVRPISQGSARFRNSVHLIPTPGIESQRPKRYDPFILKWWIAEAISLLMVALAFALEAALAMSFKHQGFHIPIANAFAFASTQFVVSFFPSLLMTPLAVLWAANDEILRWYQPYVTLARGHAAAEESLLLDYVVLSKLKTVLVSFMYKHWLIHLSAITTLATMLLHPLAGSVFEVRQTPSTQLGRVTSTRSIGLIPDVNTLNAFVASAGFAEAAVYNGLQDPPFIQGGWATATFTFPANSGLNGTMVVNTVGIQTTVNCALPSSHVLNTPAAGNYTIQSTSAQGCSNTVTIDPSESEQQYGVASVSNCGQATSINFQPVMFWFFYTDAYG